MHRVTMGNHGCKPCGQGRAPWRKPGGRMAAHPRLRHRGSKSLAKPSAAPFPEQGEGLSDYRTLSNIIKHRTGNLPPYLCSSARKRKKSEGFGRFENLRARVPGKVLEGGDSGTASLVFQTHAWWRSIVYVFIYFHWYPNCCLVDITICRCRELAMSWSGHTISSWYQVII